MGTFGNALQGAMGGAALGSTIPGLGTLAGAGIGGLAGVFGGMFGGGPAPGQTQVDQLNALYEQLGNRQGLGPAAQAGYSEFRGDQRQLIDQLRGMSQGEGPSLASQMLNQQTQSATADQYAMAGGARGNGALANRQAMNNVAMMQGQAGANAANARVQEQMSALQQLGLGIYGARGADENMNQFNTGQTNNMRVQDAQLGNMNNALRLQALQAALNGQMGVSGMQNQQPSVGDYLSAFGGGLAQMRGLGQQSQNQPQGGPSIYGTMYGPLR